MEEEEIELRVEEAEEQIVCKICWEEITFDQTCQLSCSHTYCSQCLRSYLETSIKAGQVLKISCPNLNCNSNISPEEIRATVGSNVFEKYERFVEAAKFKTDPNLRWCPRSTCHCAVLGNPNEPKIVCLACGCEICFQCREMWHPEFSCNEVKEHKKRMVKNQEKSNNKFISWTKKKKFYVRSCPRCYATIELSGGCNHMVCTSCSYSFCWLCSEEFQSDHFGNLQKYPQCYNKMVWDPKEGRRELWERRGNMAKKTGIYVGAGIAFLTLGVPAVVLGGPIYAGIKLHKAIRTAVRSKR